MTLPASNAPETVSHKLRLSVAQRVVLLAILTILAAAVVLWLRAPADPLYKRKRLSAYLYDSALPFTPPTAGTTATAFQQAISDFNRRQLEMSVAVKALGAQSIPLLSSWWQPDTGIRGRLRALAMQPRSRFGWLMRWRWIATDTHSVANNALSNVPEHAAPLIPALRQQMLGGKQPEAEQAAELFARILTALPVQQSLFDQNRDILGFYAPDPTKNVADTDVEVVASILRHGPLGDTERLIRRLWPYRNRPFTSVPSVMSKLDGDGFIQNLLYLEDGKPTEKPAAALYFKDKPRSPERVVPLLATNLTPTASANLLQNVCDALAAYGTNATPALPPLTNLLTHPKVAVREAAERAVGRIGGKVS